MREISCKIITEAVALLCIRANTVLPEDVRVKIDQAEKTEKSPLGKDVLRDLRENYVFAEKEMLPICQDTGMAVVFAELGQDVHIADGYFEDAINEGVRQGYEKGFLRKSVVKDPLRRENTGDNTPAVIHTRIVTGDSLKISLAPKGFGSENMSKAMMFLPSCSADEIIDFIVETVADAGSNPCPPVILGVGLGGTLEMAALIAKKALTRSIDSRNPDPFYAELEEITLKRINALGLGPQGFGGTTTALAVNIEAFPTHIAGLPCVVNVGCHVTRHAEAML
ncbi:MAG: fumarate hydratase [Firmicutes bacterium HGW-Firmicutes-16]|nr:MAG: fumarate hydratase [Firmicutes bacterium HGW-Firmicutes-16]